MFKDSISHYCGVRVWRIPGGTLNATSVEGKVKWCIINSHSLLEYPVDRKEVLRYWHKVVNQSTGSLSKQIYSQLAG